MSLNGSIFWPMFPTVRQELPTFEGRSVIGTMESIMKTREEWRRHLRELVNASSDPMVYALQWARDPRCMQRGTGHRRVGATLDAPVCRLWSKRG
jgi:hypothetical protein